MKLARIILVGLMLLGTSWYYQSLPESMPIHWNVRGEIDNYAPKGFAAWMLPVLAIFMLFGFAIFPVMDPKKNKYEQFSREWEIIQTVIVGFFAYLHGVTIYLSLNPEENILPLMFLGLGVLFTFIGNYLSKVRQNYFIGIRTPWTLHSTEIWNKTHRYASWWFVGVGVVTIIEAFALWYAPGIIFAGLILSGFMPVIYSYFLYAGKPERMKYVYLLIAGLVLTLGFIRGMSSEDAWICDNGTWVEHGNPSTPQPTTPCR